MGRKLQGSKRKLAYFVLQILSLAIALTRQVQEVGDLQGGKRLQFIVRSKVVHTNKKITCCPS